MSSPWLNNRRRAEDAETEERCRETGVTAIAPEQVGARAERARLREKVEAMARDPHGHFPIPRNLSPKEVASLALRRVLALLDEGTEP